MSESAGPSVSGQPTPEIVSGEYDDAAAQHDALVWENARLRSQLAEAREAKDWLAKNVDEALKAIHAAPPEIAPLATPFAPGDLPRAVAALIERAAKIRAERDHSQHTSHGPMDK